MDVQQTALWLWLANALGPAAANAADVLDAYPDPAALAAARRSRETGALFTRTQFEVLRATQPEDFIARADDCRRMGVGITVWQDDDYPSMLRSIPAPPPVLYYRGDLSAVHAPLTVAIVGTRRPSAYGVEATASIAGTLAKAGVVLVSGMASGLDSETHKAALRAGTPTIACIAFGHDQCYPASGKTLKALIEKQGLVLGEYPPGTSVQKPFFLQRNRLIAGLARGLCVAEARRISGTMNTVSAALSAGRDVFSVPGSIFSPLCEGTNRLLQQGAVPVTRGEDILEWYGLDTPEKGPAWHGETLPERASLSPDAAKMLGALTAQPQTLAALCGATGLSFGAAMAVLTQLELNGQARQLSGRQFSLKV